MKFVDYIETDKIELNFPFRSKKHLFEYLATKMAESPIESKEIYEALVRREKIGVTSLGNGVAIPHGKCLRDREVRMRIIVLNRPVNFESVDETMVQLIVCTVFPEKTDSGHDALLKQIGMFFKKYRIYRAITNAQSTQEVKEIIFSEHS